MPLHIHLASIVDNGVIEPYRVELMGRWDPSVVLHTVCAFANDLDDVGGGYIVIGLDGTEGRVSEATGLSETEPREVEDGLEHLSGLLVPFYRPVLFRERYGDADVAVIWVPCGSERPYRCPISVDEEASCVRRVFVRRGYRTVPADRRERRALFAKCSPSPFDCMVRETESITALSRQAMLDYLDMAGCETDCRDMDLGELCEKLAVSRGPRDCMSPINVGLMMFARDPERFFPYARIELVIKPDPTGDGMVEKTFRGPVHIQLMKALDYIRDVVIEEKVFKVSYQPQAIRAFNYPYEAVEETLVNAVYHRDYRMRDPITVMVTPESIEVVSSPGPGPSVSDRDLAERRLSASPVNNRRLGDFLKALGLTGHRNTGIRKVCTAMERNGSDMPVYSSDPMRRVLVVTLPVHRFFLGIEPDRDVPGAERKTSE